MTYVSERNRRQTWAIAAKDTRGRYLKIERINSSESNWK